MGMYNEVYCACPKCGAQAEMQVHQIVGGFGQFNIQDRSTLENLTPDQLQELHDAVCEEKFVCPNCHKHFNPLVQADPADDMIRKLFGV